MHIYVEFIKLIYYAYTKLAQSIKGNNLGWFLSGPFLVFMKLLFFNYFFVNIWDLEQDMEAIFHLTYYNT